MSDVNNHQVGGQHYKKFAIEIWDFITLNKIPYLEGNAIKYIARWRDKGGVEDLLKAKHYIDKLIELEDKQGETKAQHPLKPDIFVKASNMGDYARGKKDPIFALGQTIVHGSLTEEDLAEMGHPMDPRVRE